LEAVTTIKRLYEGMFLVDSALASSDWDGVVKAIEEILRRVDAEVLSIRKWDDRRLAYEIAGKSRGTYVLAYFKVDTRKVAEIERAVRLSEKFLRVLILRAERIPQEVMEQETPAMRAERERQQMRAPVGAAEQQAGGDTAEPQKEQEVSEPAAAQAAEPKQAAESEAKAAEAEPAEAGSDDQAGVEPESTNSQDVDDEKSSADEQGQ